MNACFRGRVNTGETLFLCWESKLKSLVYVQSQLPSVCYSVSQWGESADCGMIFSRNPRVDGRGWRRLLVLVAICSLTLCLATRFSFALTSHQHGHAVKSMDQRSGETKQQRLDRDATRFAEPVAEGATLTPVILYASVLPPEPSPSTDFLSLVLYNRPPPVSSILF